MHHRKHAWRAWLACGATALLLAACGGSDNDGDDLGEGPPPASASESTEGFLAYVAALAERMIDESEPFDLSGFTLPTDDADTREPIATDIDA
jgi:hypothetical protein